MKTLAFRGALLHYLDGPDRFQYWDDGLLVVRDGRVAEAGNAAEALARLPSDAQLTDYSGKLLLPGFVDCHVHYPQTDMIAAHGAELLDWLDRYTYATERRFADPEHAREVAEFFLDELARNGTTTAAVLCTVHAQSVDAFFESARARGLRMIAGKVLMDRNAPEELRDTPESGYAETRALIERWHGRDRLLYAVTPRFAASSSPEQLKSAQRLVEEFPDVYLHTHLAENRQEVAWVAKLFPSHRSYLDVYAAFGLVRPRSIFAHCIHVDDADRRLMAERGAMAAFCPTSNLFLGSGLFDLDAARSHRIPLGFGTDVGAGTSFGLLATMQDAYKVAKLAGQTLAPHLALYLATLGGAKALALDQHIGNFAPGKEADFIVIDLAATPLLQRRLRHSTDLAEKLFAWITLGDDRSIVATYIRGRSPNLHSGTEP